MNNPYFRFCFIGERSPEIGVHNFLPVTYKIIQYQKKQIRQPIQHPEGQYRQEINKRQGYIIAQHGEGVGVVLKINKSIHPRK